MAGNATDTTEMLAAVTLEDGSTVVLNIEFDGVNSDPTVVAYHHSRDGSTRQRLDVIVTTSFLTDGIDIGWCGWCEEAESQTYLDHEGHDPECPFA